MRRAAAWYGNKHAMGRARLVVRPKAEPYALASGRLQSRADVLRQARWSFSDHRPVRLHLEAKEGPPLRMRTQPVYGFTGWAPKDKGAERFFRKYTGHQILERLPLSFEQRLKVGSQAKCVDGEGRVDMHGTPL